MIDPCFVYLRELYLSQGFESKFLRMVFRVLIVALYLLLFLASCKNEEMETIQGFVPSVNTIPEGDENVDFQVSFSSTGSKSDAVVEFELIEGTARFGLDLQQASGSVEINGGEGVIQVPIVGDTNLELSESFSIRMIVADQEFMYDFTIEDDDEPGNILMDSDGFFTPVKYQSMELQWQDEFNSGVLEENDWSYEIGDGCDKGVCGWGNNELQSYTNSEDNIRVEGGYLIIQATENNGNYKSARIITQDKVEHQFGRIDIRARLPKGQGIWPAIWMLGANINEVGWPVCGEIDIMELVGHEPNVTHGTIHYDNGTGYASSTGSRSLQGTDFSEKFHVFSLLWDRDEISWYLDNEKFKSFSKREGEAYPFNSAFFFVLNVAVGGNWPGNPDDTTVFPVEMVVDYVRVFR
jgi:hypothetical protein